MQKAALIQNWVFPKLKGQENYQPWAEKMESALKNSGLWQTVEQGRDVPNDLSADPPATEAQIRTNEADPKAWKDVNNQAAELIYTMCEEKPAEAIEEEEIAQNRWLKLKSDYTDSGFVDRFTKLEELWSTSLEHCGSSIETYVANIRTKSEDLKRMGAKIDDWILVSILLKNLDPKYKEFVHRLVTQLDDNPDFDRIVTLLREKDRLQKRDHKEQPMAAALKKASKPNESGTGRGELSRGGRCSSSRRGGRGDNNNTADSGPQISENSNRISAPETRASVRVKKINQKDPLYFQVGKEKKERNKAP